MTKHMTGCALLALSCLSACARRQPTAAQTAAIPVPMPEYAAAWQPFQSTLWGIQLRLLEGIEYVSGPTRADCAPDTGYTRIIEWLDRTHVPSDSAAKDAWSDAPGLEISFARGPFTAIAEGHGFMWRPAGSTWNDEPGWDVYGEGPTGASVLEGNGYFGLGGEPLVKIFLTPEECVNMEEELTDSATRAQRVAQAKAEDRSCGSVHDNRPRYFAVVQRPGDRCYLVLSRPDGEDVSALAETIRFMQDGQVLAPLGARPPEPFTFAKTVGIVTRLDEWHGCFVIRNAELRPGTPLTMIATQYTNEQAYFATVGTPMPEGCATAPPGYSGGSDSTRFYAYQLYESDTGTLMNLDQPMIAVLGKRFTDAQIDSLHNAENAMVNDPNAKLRLLIDVDGNGRTEAFAQQERSDSLYFTVTRGAAASAPVLWTATFPNVKPTQKQTGPNSYVNEWYPPKPATAAPLARGAKLAALVGVIERDSIGDVCLTIANPHLPVLQRITTVVAGHAGRLHATVAWRPAAPCPTRTDIAHGRSYSLVVDAADSLALPPNSIGFGVVEENEVRGGFEACREGSRLRLSIPGKSARQPQWRAFVERLAPVLPECK